jgi:hypothetical protein
VAGANLEKIRISLKIVFHDVAVCNVAQVFRQLPVVGGMRHVADVGANHLLPIHARPRASFKVESPHVEL